MKPVGNWTRDYFYNTDDNYLLGHTNGTTEYTYDEHEAGALKKYLGDIFSERASLSRWTSMPHLSSMQWDYKDKLKDVTLNASGERVRKVIEKTGGIVEERIYLGGYEIYRKTISGTLNFERETLHFSDDTKKIASVETKIVENGSLISTPASNIRYQYDNHLGSASLELDDTAAIISYEEYHPFGTTSYRSGRTETEVSLKRYKYVGKERDEETGLYYYGARYYAGWIARFVSVDPLVHLRLWVSPYNFVQNNPINRVDPTGALDGDYYDTDGNHLGNDRIDDKKVYVVSSVTKNDKGVVTGAENRTDLGITHTEFRKQASTVYGESSAYKLSSVTDNLKKEMFAIASVHQKNSLAFGANSDKAKEYLALTPSAINKSKFKTTANAAVINAVTGGFDYSYGATMWDGREQALFPSTDNRRSTGKFELHMNTMGWNISDAHFKTWKSNVGSSFKAPQQKSAPANFGNYQNKGKMRLNSTAVYGETIFWKIK